MDDRVHSVDGWHQRHRLRQVGLDRTNVCTMRNIVRQWPAMVHQPQLMRGREEVAREPTTKVARRARNQNRVSIRHGKRVVKKPWPEKRANVGNEPRAATNQRASAPFAG